MGIDPTLLPDKILCRMDKKDRPRGNAGLTAQEAIDKHNLRLERDEQRLFAQWLNLHGLPHVWHATHKRSTATTGVFDFWTGYCGRSLWIEFKRGPGAFISQAQKEFGQKLRVQSIEYYVVYSAAEAIAIINLSNERD